MTDNSLDDLARKLAESVPEGLRSMQADLEKNFGSVLRAGLVKLDLVTREEFDVQEAVLARTRENSRRRSNGSRNSKTGSKARKNRDA